MSARPILDTTPKAVSCKVSHFWYTYCMPTTKQRIAISVDKDMSEALKLIAKRDKVPVASAASDLLRIALEIDEDMMLGAIMEERDTPDANYVSLDEVRKQVYSRK